MKEINMTIFEIYVNGRLEEVYTNMQDAAARAIVLEDDLGEGNVEIAECSLTQEEINNL